MRRRYEFAWTGGASALLIAVVTACGASTTGTVTPSPTVESTPLSPAPSIRNESVTVAGGQLELWCDGEGPTVMFLSGIGGDHSLIPIGQQLSDDAYACFYDRPGDGPPPPDRPRTAGSDAVDLHELLAVAEIPKPVVLVAHSYGGLIAVIAAAEHPEDIAGVVFVDASQPGAEERFYAILTDGQRAYFDGRLKNFPYVDWPTSLLEAADALPSFPPVPVTVITATRSFLDPCDEQLPCDELQALWLEAQDQFATTLTPDARHVLAATGHYVHEDDPALVETEIRALLARIEH
jgi:pimeloyl-ACP methyl ester carboxylesterase